MSKAKMMLAAVAVTAGLGACTRVDVSQNESAIKTVNGVVTEENVKEGGHWIWASINKIEYPKINHKLNNISIVVADTGQPCEKDCIPALQTSDFQTVSGSLRAQYSVDRYAGVAKDFFNLRGAASQEDIENKLIEPAFQDCLIGKVNVTSVKDLNDNGEIVVGDIKTCLQTAMKPLRITIHEIYNLGFGPSPEARQGMKVFADARQAGQVADVRNESAEKRMEAAKKDAEIMAAALRVYKDKGISEDTALQALCLTDPLSVGRPCITGTGSGSGVAVAVTPK